jgi:hypothetical protein
VEAKVHGFPTYKEGKEVEAKEQHIHGRREGSGGQ